MYPNILLYIVPVPHGPELPVPNPPQGDETVDDSNCSEKAEDFEDPIYSAEGGTNEKNYTIPTKRTLMI